MRQVLLTAVLVMLAATVRLVVTNGISNNTYLMAGITACLFIYWAFYKSFIKKLWLNVLIGIVLFNFLAMVGFIAAYGIKGTTDFSEDAALVLGAGIRDGEVLTLLAHRLDKAVEYHEKNPTAYIVVSGGLGRGETITEALAMERYLVARGVPQELIFREERAFSTHTNILYAQPILEDLFEDAYTVAIITSDFHIYRSVQFARRAGMEVNWLPAPIPWYATLANYTREVSAVIKMWLIGE
jgi:uncharacterized SAM-binding protein YcdF (DUF218 family)